MELRAFAEEILLVPSLSAKLTDGGRLTDKAPGEPKRVDEPARPAHLSLRSERKPPSFPSANQLHDPEARARALHTFANHELLALELLALMLLRFPDAPKGYRMSLAATMLDEQRHLRLYLQRMKELGVEFGDYGLSAFFWDALAEVPSAASFAAAMGMTLEQANLDFSRHFSRAFEASGDHRSAAILRQIYQDEIGHLRQGRRWFDRLNEVPLKEADETLYARWAQALHPPMTPARGRGIEFDDEGRRKAGLPANFIEEVALARHSRGRPPVVYWMNPACELRMAHPGPLPQAALTLERDLQSLPVSWAKADDVVLVRSKPPLDLQRRWVGAGLELPQWEVLTDDQQIAASLLDRLIADIRPWAWDSEARQLLAPLIDNVGHPQSQANDTLIEPVAMQRRLELHRKDKWQRLTEQFCGPEHTPHVCTAIEELQHYVANHSHTPLIAKAPLGSAGRGALRIPRRQMSEPLTQPEQRWLTRTLQRQGSVVIGPWLPRVVDLSVLLKVGVDGQVDVRGVSRFFTDARGQYSATVLGPATVGLESKVRAFWHGGSDRQQSVLARLSTVAQQVGEELYEAGFCGLAGVDALIWRDETLRLLPLLEVNPRRTMGHVALDLQRNMAAGHSGLLLMLGRPALRALGVSSLNEGYQVLTERVGPLQTNSAGKLSKGVVALADPTQAQLSLPLWVVCQRAPALIEAMRPLNLPWSGAHPSPFEQL